MPRLSLHESNLRQFQLPIICGWTLIHPIQGWQGLSSPARRVKTNWISPCWDPGTCCSLGRGWGERDGDAAFLLKDLQKTPWPGMEKAGRGQGSLLGEEVSGCLGAILALPAKDAETGSLPAATTDVQLEQRAEEGQ